MPQAKTVYVASDKSEHETMEEARRHDVAIKLKAIEDKSVPDLIAGIFGADDAIREAIIAANNLVQGVRKERGLVKARQRAGDRPPQPAVQS